MYFMSITRCSEGDFFKDYLVNPEKRMSHVTMHEDFWERYKKVYARYREDGDIIWRSKHVENGIVNISQVFRNEKKRRKFQIEAGYNEYYSYDRIVDFDYEDRECDLADVDDLIDHVMSQPDYIIQWCVPTFRRKGMIIGDPLKNDKLFEVE